jgi:hypothetical protein
MNTNLIGDKAVFAIEYEVLSTELYGSCILWLGGNCLGGLEGEVFLDIVCQRLERISVLKNQIFLASDLYTLSNTELFDLMQEDKIDETGLYWFLYTEGFDLFRKYVYRQGEVLYFLWQLKQEVWPEFETQGISTQLFSFHLPISLYEEVTRQFKCALMELTQSQS